MIASGTLLIEDGIVLPDSIILPKNESSHTGWTSLHDVVGIRQLKNDLAIAGWSYFYMGAIKQTARGVGKGDLLTLAMKGICAKAKREKCNSLQIDHIREHAFLGIPGLSVSAHCCHIQESAFFRRTSSVGRSSTVSKMDSPTLHAD